MADAHFGGEPAADLAMIDAERSDWGVRRALVALKPKSLSSPNTRRQTPDPGEKKTPTAWGPSAWCLEAGGWADLVASGLAGHAADAAEHFGGAFGIGIAVGDAAGDFILEFVHATDGVGSGGVLRVHA